MPVKLSGAEMVAKVEEQKKTTGETTQKVCKALGVNPGSYYAWRKRLKPKAKAKPKKYSRKNLLVRVPLDTPPAFQEEETAEVLIVRGKPSQIAKILAGRYGQES